MKQRQYESEYNGSSYSAAITNTAIITLTHQSGPPLLVDGLLLSWNGASSSNAQAAIIITGIYEPMGNRFLVVGNTPICHLGIDRTSAAPRIFRDVKNRDGLGFRLASNQKLIVYATTLSSITIGVGDIGITLTGDLEE